MRITDIWLRDLPQQFQGKKRIEILISAFAKQLEELSVVFRQLDLETDLERAVGANLDMAGSILSLSRKDANAIICKSRDYMMTDEVYRKALKYKALINSCDCTYYDIMESISLLWDTSSISYAEPPDRPATVLLNLPTVGFDSVDPSIGKILTIKPAGVSLFYTVGYLEKVYYMLFEKVSLPLMTIRAETTWPESAQMKNVRVSYSAGQPDEKISAMLISKRNIWYFDGKEFLDGSRYLNAMEKKEGL